MSLLLLFLVSLFHFANSASPTTPTNKFILPIVKDTTRLKYYTSFLLGTPSVRQYVTVDLSAPSNWVHGNLTGYTNSSTYRPVRCYTSACDAYSGKIASCVIYCPGPRSPVCNNKQCTSLINTPPLSNYYSFDPLIEDIITFYKFDPQKDQQCSPTPFSSLTKAFLPHFPFASTSSTSVFKGLSQYTKGVLTLSRSPISLHTQLARAFRIPRRFALCLPSSSSGLNGAAYFGAEPYFLPPSKVNLSNFIVFTKLISNSHSVFQQYDLNDPSFEYYIKIRSIKIDGSPVLFNSSLLDIDKRGDGGSKLSTTVHYTSLHSDIYKPFVELFALKGRSMNITRVRSVTPFGACFSSKTIHYNAKSGRGLPIIDFVLEGKSSVLHNKNARWRIYGSNSMVKVSEDVQCLAVVDAGPRTGLGIFPSVVVGGKQMEDNLVVFDLGSSKVGVTTSLLRFGTSCSQFKGI